MVIKAMFLNEITQRRKKGRGLSPGAQLSSVTGEEELAKGLEKELSKRV